MSKRKLPEGHKLPDGWFYIWKTNIPVNWPTVRWGVLLMILLVIFGVTKDYVIPYFAS